MRHHGFLSPADRPLSSRVERRLACGGTISFADHRADRRALSADLQANSRKITRIDSLCVGVARDLIIIGLDESHRGIPIVAHAGGAFIDIESKNRSKFSRPRAASTAKRPYTEAAKFAVIYPINRKSFEAAAPAASARRSRARSSDTASFSGPPSQTGLDRRKASA